MRWTKLFLIDAGFTTKNLKQAKRVKLYYDYLKPYQIPDMEFIFIQIAEVTLMLLYEENRYGM